MITRVLATAAATALGGSLLLGSAPAQAVSADIDWLGPTSGTVTVEEVSSASRVTLLATGSSVLLAYRELNAVVILSSADSPSSQFEEWGRIDTTGEVIVSPPRLDAGPDESIVVSYLVRVSDTESRLRVLPFDASGQAASSWSVPAIVTAEGYDLGISDSGVITTVYAEKFDGENRISVTFAGETAQPREQRLVIGTTVGSPRIVVGSDGRALVVYDNLNVNTGTLTLHGVYRAPEADSFDNFVDLYDGQPVTQWDIDGDASAYVSLFVQDAASGALKARNSAVPTNNWEPADFIQGPTEDLRWLSVDVTSPSAKTYFYNKLEEGVYERTYSRARSVQNPASGVLQTMFTGLQQGPNAARVTGVDSEGLPWAVQSLVNGPGEAPQLMSATYSENPDGTSINRLGSVVGTAAPFGIATADAVALDNGSLLAAWVALADNKMSLFTRWMAPTAPPVAIPVDPGPDPDPGPDLDPDPGPDPVEESIMVSGSRGDVRGKRGIIVEGTTTGLVGETVMPRYKFRGQPEYSDGVARRTVEADGTFTWQRRTGKKIYIIFKTVDGSVQSDRIIIR
jgi:hypothetical protein